eukprot:CAMPEP_0113470386 /NCGR_PEP_ID=MMETSP0014_2-20120614/16414_1 /TAXON_ID=2857 /ORGANISM="Nitzschia sp." /LENGTH=458 /DNA_ID=CAMNT_0000362945 /DNA_START=294 /DNA_END=1670 /DNA_ORIENTATION=- /assembly_acc=CAM_ASM_000159
MTLMLMSSFSPLDDPNDSQYPNSRSNRQRQRQDQDLLQQQKQPQEDNDNNTPFPSSFLPHSGTTATEKGGSSNHTNTTNATTGVTWKTSSATTTATTAVTAATTTAAASSSSSSPAAGSGLGYGYHCAKPKSLFPWKLRQLINDAMVEGNAGIVSWLPDGTGFKVYEPELFASQILKRYFRQSHFRSFTRQLYHYGFERVQTGPNRGAFYHAMFQRDNESLCLSMGHKHRGSASAAVIKDNRQQLLGSNPSHHSSSTLTHCHLPPPPSPQMTRKNFTHNRIFGTRDGYSNPISMPVMQQDHIAAPAFHNSVSLSTQIYPIVHSSPNVARGVQGGNGKGNGAEGVQMMMDCFTQSQQQLMLIQKQQPRQYYQSQSPQQPQNPFILNNNNNNNTDSELTPDCIEALLMSLKDIPNESQPTTHTPQEEASRPDGENELCNLDLLLEPRPIEEMAQLQQKKF